MDHIILFKPEYLEFFLPEASFQKLAANLIFAEGPVWDCAKSCLFFTDFSVGIIYQWTHKEGSLPYRTQANRPIGLTLSNDGRIISAESSAHRIAYVNQQRSEPIAGTYQGKRFHSPNDVIAKRDGSIWFTDPYSVAMGEQKELDINGVYKVTPTGDVILVYGGLERPNGLAFSPDERILYVNDTNLQQIFKIAIHEDGSFDKPILFATLDTSYGEGAADGMKVDTAGNVWVTGPGGIWVITPEGIPAALIRCPELVGNFCFGGQDNSTLYIAASTSVYSLQLGIEGLKGD